MKRIDVPVGERTIRALRVGDEVALSGVIVTARDAAHKLMVERRPDIVRSHLAGGAIYHAGPIMLEGRAGWSVVSAGPTTSIREEPYEAAVIAEYGVRAVIGKGGMGPATLEALGRHGAVYLHAVGGAAVYLAGFVRRVPGVLMLEELGVPEAFWLFEVDGFPAVVTMDSHGGSLHALVADKSRRSLDALLGG
jgi:fumarate hydratase subunit beta